MKNFITEILIHKHGAPKKTRPCSNKCRGENRSLETLINDLKELGLKNGKVSIGHCQNEGSATKLKQMIESTFEKAQVEIHKLRGLCSFYAEKGGLLVGFEKI